MPDDRPQLDPAIARTVDELKAMRVAASAMGGTDRLEQRAASGRLNCRERVALLLDPGSFVEIGLLARSQSPQLHDRTPADGLVAGYGTIDGRVVYVMSEDGTVLAGTRGRVAEAKSARIRELAFLHQCPLVNLMEAGAGRFQENNGAMAAGIGVRFREHHRLSGRVPQVAAVMGGCFGGPSFTAMQSDYVCIVKGSGFIGMSGPPLVKVGIGEDVTSDMIGGADKSAVETGQVDYVAADDADCLRRIREFLSYFPANSQELPPRAAPAPAAVDSDAGKAELLALVPENLRRAYSMEKLLRLVVDDGRLFLYREKYGANLITAWCRFGGQTVGVIANNPMRLAGAMDDKSARKMHKFVDICDAFHIPLVFFTDCPGFMVGPKIESERMVSLAARCLNAVIGATVPKLTIVVRKAIGLAYLAMGGKAMNPDLIVAWPYGRFDVMGPAAGVELVYGKEIAKAPDPAARREELLRQMDEQSRAHLAAEMAVIDDVILPTETRDVILGALLRCRDRLQPGFKHRIDP
jgi:acetyl-CoA carboxylase carboxyltransferase component